ncbi:hypothetical protein BRD17_08315 [Halobacteriales archaeon SW_7_68_16]|nr:MAG: hypothetical protein BRD17_08315 [Halobacteriales archaeon SW_7_68_16]
MARTIVVPFAFPDPEPLPESLIETLRPLDVVLFAHHDPDGTTEAMDEATFEREAKATLYETAADLVRSGGDADIQLFYGPDEDVRDRMAADAILVPRPVTTVGRFLVPLRDDRTAGQVADLVGDLSPDAVAHLTLLHVVDDEEAVDEGDRLLRDAMGDLREAGISQAAIDTDVIVDDDAPEVIARESNDYDAIVMGETAEDADRDLGRTYDRVAAASDRPVIVVRRRSST